MIGGNMFTSVGGSQATWSLDDLKIVDGDPNDPTRCTIQFLQATNPKTMNEKFFYYVPRELAGDQAGWYYRMTVPGKCAADNPVSAADKIVPAGNGFLVNFPVATAKLVYSGEVQTGANGKISFGRSDAGPYAFFCNPVPNDVLLKNIEIVDGDPNDPTRCTIQFLSATSPKTVNERFYYYVPRALAGDQAGWYYRMTVPGKCAADNPVPATEKLCAGEGILINFPVAAAKLVFDSPIK